PGRNVMIGGLGQDSLTGGKSDDLLISGTTSFDNNSSALAAIMLEWTSGTPYAKRVSHLLGTTPGGKNGNVILSATTVVDDALANSLTGGLGLDWFFKGTNDLVNDLNLGLKKPSEVVTTVP